MCRCRLGVPAGSPRELVTDGFVPVAGLGLLQGAELAQRLELVGAGRDAGGFALFGFPGGGGRGFGGEQLIDSLPLLELSGRRTSSAADPGTPGGRSDG
jgi:hypothetical protein